MIRNRRYDLGFEEIDDCSMYEDYTPIITINDDYGDLKITLIGKEAINHYIKTGEILNGNHNTNKQD